MFSVVFVTLALGATERLGVQGVRPVGSTLLQAAELSAARADAGGPFQGGHVMLHL